MVAEVATAPQTTVLLDEFEFSSGQIIGRGSYATVFAGKSLKSGQKVAVKKIADAKLKLAELDILLRMNCAYIVQVYSVARIDQCTFLIMERMQTTLDDHLCKLVKNGQKMDSANLQILTNCLAVGCKYMADNSIIHRDIKPENILVNYEGEENNNNPQAESRIESAKFADFGLSHISTEEKRSFTNLAGTFYYMAPGELHSFVF